MEISKPSQWKVNDKLNHETVKAADETIAKQGGGWIDRDTGGSVYICSGCHIMPDGKCWSGWLVKEIRHGW